MLRHLPINEWVNYVLFCPYFRTEFINKSPDNQLPSPIKMNDNLLPSQSIPFSFQRNRANVLGPKFSFFFSCQLKILLHFKKVYMGLCLGEMANL